LVLVGVLLLLFYYFVQICLTLIQVVLKNFFFSVFWEDVTTVNAV
jgi:hypothetical protein